MEHISQRTFTRKHGLNGNELERGSCRFDSLGFRLGFPLVEACQFHHFGRINASLAENRSDFPGQVERKLALFEALRVFEIRIAGMADTEFVSHPTDREGRNGGFPEFFEAGVD
ncbi:hypothetical protein [Novosphingobium pituita]|uniref:hypothetical protein n=1 Tax=Novosphingobium pituita TaxID=3056842 RepID=UPI00295E65A5|nr:hypothetical protein [Novosphingobium sp. IK01]